MLSYEKIPVPCTYGNFHNTFSRIYNLLDHPSKDYYQSKYSRYNGIVLSTNEGASKDDVNHNKKDPGTGWLVLLSAKWESWAKLSVNFCCRQNYNVKVITTAAWCQYCCFKNLNMETECDKDSLYTDNSFQEFFLNLSQIYCTDFPDRQKLKGHCYKSITIVL